ncbi:hypothetical protein D3C86_1590300 [compost metagenome]
MFPADICWNVRVFYKNWKNNSHVLDGGLPVGQWSDLCYRIPRCLFGELEKFIEIEKGLETLEWEKKLVWNEDWGVGPDEPSYGQPTHQALAAIESEAIYLWFKANKDRDLYEESGWSSVCEAKRTKGIGLFGEQSQEEKEALEELGRLEEEYEEQETEMLIRLIKIRSSLWT